MFEIYTKLIRGDQRQLAVIKIIEGKYNDSCKKSNAFIKHQML